MRRSVFFSSFPFSLTIKKKKKEKFSSKALVFKLILKQLETSFITGVIWVWTTHQKEILIPFS